MSTHISPSAAQRYRETRRQSVAGRREKKHKVKNGEARARLAFLWSIFNHFGYKDRALSRICDISKQQLYTYRLADDMTLSKANHLLGHIGLTFDWEFAQQGVTYNLYPHYNQGEARKLVQKAATRGCLIPLAQEIIGSGMPMSRWCQVYDIDRLRLHRAFDSYSIYISFLLEIASKIGKEVHWQVYEKNLAL